MGMLKKQRSSAEAHAERTSKALAPHASAGIEVSKPGEESQQRGEGQVQRGALGPGLVRAGRWRGMPWW